MSKLIHKFLFISIIVLNSNCFAQSNWTASNNGLPTNAYVSDFAQTSNGDIYVIINSNGQGQLLISTNNGSSWSNVTTSGLPTGTWAGSLFAKGNTLFLGAGSLGLSLYSSTNYGQSWIAANNGIPANAYVSGFAQTSNGDIYIIINSNGQGQLLISTNNGSAWSSVTTSGLPTGAWAGSLFAKGNTLFLGAGSLGLSLYSSTNYGQSWIAANNGIPANAYVSGFAQTSNGDIYIIINSNGQGQLLISTNNGTSWSNVTTSGLPTGAWAGSLYANGNTLFLGSGGLGSFLYISAIITGINEGPNSTTLVIYPNPSDGQINITSSTIIDYVQIIDIFGHLICKQKNSSCKFTYSIYKNGLYVIMVVSGRQKITQKVLVIL